jgi:murein DD-endopeptidase MepM/ murein hydrolase activator NlpD
MQARIAVAFALGFASGMAALAIGLWSTDHLAGYQQEVALAAPTSALTPAPVAFQPPSFDRGKRTQPTALPGPLSTQTTPAPTGQADRLAVGPQLAMPVANIDPGRLESTFTQRRNGHAHEALDIMAPRGTPVLAVAEGSVAKLFTSKQGGLTVYQFDDSQTWCYYYGHLDHYAPGLKEGHLLRKGEVLGFVGSTGDASPEAPHLHFAVFQLGPEKHWWQGRAVDPLPLLR